MMPTLKSVSEAMKRPQQDVGPPMPPAPNKEAAALAKESAAAYRRAVAEINRTTDREIERALAAR